MEEREQNYEESEEKGGVKAEERGMLLITNSPLPMLHYVCEYHLRILKQETVKRAE